MATYETKWVDESTNSIPLRYAVIISSELPYESMNRDLTPVDIVIDGKVVMTIPKKSFKIRHLKEVVEYDSYINSIEWADFRQKYFERHPRECTICGSKDVVQIHHINYNSLGCEKDDDLIALCRGCHQKVHGLKEFFSAYQQEYESECISAQIASQQAIKLRMFEANKETIKSLIEENFPKIDSYNVNKTLDAIWRTVLPNYPYSICKDDLRAFFPKKKKKNKTKQQNKQ